METRCAMTAMVVAGGVRGLPQVARARTRIVKSATRGYTFEMKTAGVKDARDRFSAYLDEVRRGNEVVITEHGKPVAMLIPIGGASKETLAYWRAVADGTIEQQTSPRSKPIEIKWPNIDLTDAQVQQALDDEREE